MKQEAMACGSLTLLLLVKQGGDKLELAIALLPVQAARLKLEEMFKSLFF